MIQYQLIFILKWTLLLIYIYIDTVNVVGPRPTTRWVLWFPSWLASSVLCGLGSLGIFKASVLVLLPGKVLIHVRLECELSVFLLTNLSSITLVNATLLLTFS